METQPTEQNDNDKAYSWGEVKVGRGHYYVNVGEVENLYKTSKHRKLSPTSKQIPLDLHGHTKEQAVAALNENLPSWIETAMKGEYPFLVQVEIVCGKGNQILAEVVEGWIKHEKHVANAPRMRN
jgi:DNA-nicking Smr family endonuclease